MPDLTDQLMPKIQQHRLPELDLPEEFIQPNYQGLSILKKRNPDTGPRDSGTAGWRSEKCVADLDGCPGTAPV